MGQLSAASVPEKIIKASNKLLAFLARDEK